VLAFCWVGLTFAQTVSTPALAIRDVTLIDGTGTPAQPGMTVVVEKNRISSVNPSPASLPRGIHVVEGRGKYLIPGLWDAHVHALWDANRPGQFFPLFLANGVTSVRPIWPGSITVADAPQARKAADDLQAFGMDFIKVYSQVPREVYFALADEARAKHIPFAGHVPLDIDADEASSAGQLSIEHLMGVLLASSSSGDELKKHLRAGANINQLNDALVNTFDVARATALFKLFVRNGTWQVPTLTIRHARPFLAELAAAHDSRLQYMEKSITDGWTPRDDPRQPGTQAAIESRKRLYAKELEVVGLMHRNGVRIVAGTDTPGRISSSGTIEKGKFANLVLLDANPLADIHNTRRIDAVILHGRLFTRNELDGMLADVARKVS
jgi:imidazolonepropionase-like amidohydrolase